MHIRIVSSNRGKNGKIEPTVAVGQSITVRTTYSTKVVALNGRVDSSIMIRGSKLRCTGVPVSSYPYGPANCFVYEVLRTKDKKYGPGTVYRFYPEQNFQLLRNSFIE
jgi:hypothetical protein